MPAQSHRSNPTILGRRTLERDHRRLAALLQPAHSVLDVGCGTGAITAGIARAVGPLGFVVGFDRDKALLEMARKEYGALGNLSFEHGDATELPFWRQFDIVNAARTLQWIARPALAISKMAGAAVGSGTLVVLDYNHLRNTWKPDPPAAFMRFYKAFLAWRDANHWDNEMADHLPELFRAAGLIAIESSVQDEIAERGQPDFAERSTLWSHVIESAGAKIAEAGFCTAADLEEASETYTMWTETAMVRQVLSMRTITGSVPVFHEKIGSGSV